MNSDTPPVTPWLDANEVKRQVQIEAVLEHYDLFGRLRGNGAQRNSHSPFRKDNNPSFSVNLERGVWNDGAGRPVIDGQEVPGNVIGLVMAIENCSFREALLKLHKGFIAPNSVTGSSDSTSQRIKQERGKVQETLRKEHAEKTANIPFGRELKGRTNIPPLLKRGLTEETIKEFGVVYCTSGMMKGRIAFPIRNSEGHVMAYAGRAIKKDDEEKRGKYRFPPKFNKSLELFNIERIANDAETKKAVKNYGIIVVEGFVDAMNLHQEGFKNVVAVMGTDFHDAQKSKLLDPKLNPTRRITLFLDNDEAGTKGRSKMARALMHDAFIRLVDYSQAPKGKTEPEHFDRDELIDLLSLRT